MNNLYSALLTLVIENVNGHASVFNLATISFPGTTDHAAIPVWYRIHFRINDVVAVYSLIGKSNIGIDLGVSWSISWWTWNFFNFSKLEQTLNYIHQPNVQLSLYNSINSTVRLNVEEPGKEIKKTRDWNKILFIRLTRFQNWKRKLSVVILLVRTSSKTDF